ncbi:MAG: hypothetical protein FWG16_03510 [Micrococcales bacterium]|nr:hypothetical protein [Micrococcales bacterium]
MRFSYVLEAGSWSRGRHQYDNVTVDTIAKAVEVLETRQESGDFLVITNEETNAILLTMSPAGPGPGAWLVEYSVPEVQMRGLFTKRPTNMETVYEAEVSKTTFMELVQTFLAEGALAPGLPGFEIDRKEKLLPPDNYVD